VSRGEGRGKTIEMGDETINVRRSGDGHRAELRVATAMPGC